MDGSASYRQTPLVRQTFDPVQPFIVCQVFGATCVDKPSVGQMSFEKMTWRLIVATLQTQDVSSKIEFLCKSVNTWLVTQQPFKSNYSRAVIVYFNIFGWKSFVLKPQIGANIFYIQFHLYYFVSLINKINCSNPKLQSLWEKFRVFCFFYFIFSWCKAVAVSETIFNSKNTFCKFVNLSSTS
jgi:hypothetical protein